MDRGAGAGGAQPTRDLVGDGGAHAVPEQRERAVVPAPQLRQHLLHQTGDGGDERLLPAVLTARVLDGQHLNRLLQAAGKGQKGGGGTTGVRKTHQTQLRVPHRAVSADPQTLVRVAGRGRCSGDGWCGTGTHG